MDTLDPFASVSINSGDDYTDSRFVWLSCSASDSGSGVDMVRYRNAGDTYTAWEAFDSFLSWELASGSDGLRTVEYEVMDNAGNVEHVEDDITLDTISPVTTLTIGTPNSGSDPTYVSPSTTFSLSASDSTSGVDITEYKFDMHGDNSAIWLVYTGGSFTAPGIGAYDLKFYSIDNAGNSETINSEYIIVGGTTLTYSGDISGQYSDQVTLSATLTDTLTGDPISGKTITFEIDTTPILTDSDSTDGSGSASADITLMRPSGTYTVTASFAGDTSYMPSSDSVTFTINKEDVILDYTGDTFVYTAGPTIDTAPVRLSATLTQDDDGFPGDITLALVTFKLEPDTGPPIMVEHVPVNSAGEVLTTEIIPVGSCDVTIYIESNPYWKTDTDTNILTVDSGSGKRMVTGGGWIPDQLSINGKGNFAFTVNYNKKGGAKGNFIYTYRTENYIYKVKSNSWVHGGLSFTEIYKAFFTGKNNIQVIDRETGEVVDSWGNCIFLVDITDGDLTDPTTVDTIAITVLNSDGSIWRQIGTPGDQIELGGGNIVIHSK